MAGMRVCVASDLRSELLQSLGQLHAGPENVRQVVRSQDFVHRVPIATNGDFENRHPSPGDRQMGREIFREKSRIAGVTFFDEGNRLSAVTPGAFVMIVGFVACDLLYKKAAKVPGF